MTRGIAKSGQWLSEGFTLGLPPRALPLERSQETMLRMRSAEALYLRRENFGASHPKYIALRPQRSPEAEPLVGVRGHHAPAFVLTHHAHAPIEMEGGTTFHFSLDGFEAAYAQAREAAGGDGIDIAGGASTVRQALLAGVIDELWLYIAPVLLGSGD